MARQARQIRPDVFYHVLNRSAGRIALFKKDADFAAFERIMLEASLKFPLRIVDWCLMKNHWHFIVWPRKPEEVTDYFRWLTHTHAMRWRVAHASVGWGHLYQGRFKAFPIQQGKALRLVRRYVQRNALSAGVVKEAESWRWGSLWARREGDSELKSIPSPDAPVLGTQWIDWVNTPFTKKELSRLRTSVARGVPLGDTEWVLQTAREQGLEHTLRPEGRPRNARLAPSPFHAF